MVAELSGRVREIAQARDLSESAVFEQALERGLETSWEDVVLSAYFAGDLSKEEAVERLGRAKVERADREQEVVTEDAWLIGTTILWTRGTRGAPLDGRAALAP